MGYCFKIPLGNLPELFFSVFFPASFTVLVCYQRELLILLLLHFLHWKLPNMEIKVKIVVSNIT